MTAPAESALVLVVDDDPETRALVCEVLDADGLRTITAADGEDALASAERYRPDLIILDVMMRGMDGYTALTHLQGHAATRGIPVIMLTGQEEKIYRILSIGGGATLHLTKPFTPKALMQAVRQILSPGP
jgi:CheY-like chemotaxis protein